MKKEPHQIAGGRRCFSRPLPLHAPDGTASKNVGGGNRKRKPLNRRARSPVSLSSETPHNMIDGKQENMHTSCKCLDDAMETWRTCMHTSCKCLEDVMETYMEIHTIKARVSENKTDGLARHTQPSPASDTQGKGALGPW